MEIPETCYFDEEAICNKNSEGGINIRSQIEFILGDNTIPRNNSYYDTLPDVTKNFLRRVMENSLGENSGVPPCDECVVGVEPVAVSAVSLSILSGYEEVERRAINIQKITDRLAKIDSTITNQTIDDLAPYKG